MLNKKALERLYTLYNKREFVHPDPLEFLYNYPNKRDREIVGLIASSLAYGRVAQILKSTAFVLDKLGSSPYAFITGSSDKKILSAVPNFKHRFHTESDITSLILGIKGALKRHGSLEACFLKGLANKEGCNSALSFFVGDISHGRNVSMISSPEKGSACKRLNLFLRWMVRHDDVDPGGWDKVSPSELIVPLDTHMHKIGILLQATKRKQANMATAVEITDAFREISPQDPVKYDFALTRFGIRSDLGGMVELAGRTLSERLPSGGR